MVRPQFLPWWSGSLHVRHRMMGDNRRRQAPPPLSADTKHWHDTTTHRHWTVMIQKMELHQSFSSPAAFIAHPSLTFYLKCVKTKKQVCCCFCPFKLKTPWLGWAAGGQGHFVWAQQPKYLLELRPGAKIILVSPVSSKDALCCQPGGLGQGEFTSNEPIFWNFGKYLWECKRQ